MKQGRHLGRDGVIGDLCMRCTVLPGRANEGRYVSRLRQRGDGSNTARTTIHVHMSRPKLSMGTADYRGDWIGLSDLNTDCLLKLWFASISCTATDPGQ
jgi:hypothetical protein